MIRLEGGNDDNHSVVKRKICSERHAHCLCLIDFFDRLCA